MRLNKSTQINVHAHIFNMCKRTDYQLKTIVGDVPRIELWKGRRQQGKFESECKGKVGRIFLVFSALIMAKADSECLAQHGNGRFE